MYKLHFAIFFGVGLLSMMSLFPVSTQAQADCAEGYVWREHVPLTKCACRRHGALPCRKRTGLPLHVGNQVAGPMVQIPAGGVMYGAKLIAVIMFAFHRPVALWFRRKTD